MVLILKVQYLDTYAQFDVEKPEDWDLIKKLVDSMIDKYHMKREGSV